MRWKKRRWRDDERKKWEKRKQSEEVAGEGKEQRQNTTNATNKQETRRTLSVLLQLRFKQELTHFHRHRAQTGTSWYRPHSRPTDCRVCFRVLPPLSVGSEPEEAADQPDRVSKRSVGRSVCWLWRDAGSDHCKDTFILLHPPSSSLLLPPPPGWPSAQSGQGSFTPFVKRWNKSVGQKNGAAG